MWGARWIFLPSFLLAFLLSFFPGACDDYARSFRCTCTMGGTDVYDVTKGQREGSQDSGTGNGHWETRGEKWGGGVFITFSDEFFFPFWVQPASDAWCFDLHSILSYHGEISEGGGRGEGLEGRRLNFFVEGDFFPGSLTSYYDDGVDELLFPILAVRVCVSRSHGITRAES